MRDVNLLIYQAKINTLCYTLKLNEIMKYDIADVTLRSVQVCNLIMPIKTTHLIILFHDIHTKVWGMRGNIHRLWRHGDVYYLSLVLEQQYSFIKTQISLEGTGYLWIGVKSTNRPSLLQQTILMNHRMGIESTPAAPAMSFTEGSFKMDLQHLFAMEGILISFLLSSNLESQTITQSHPFNN